MNLIEFIKVQIEMPPAFYEAMDNIIKTETFPKGTLLLKEGEVCRNIFFVEKGCLRFFFYDQAGKDITHSFVFEGEFITEIDSIFNFKPSEFYIETIEDCVLNTFMPTSMLSISRDFPKFEQFKEVMLTQALIKMGERIKDLQLRDAKSRYNHLISKHPDVLFRAPLGHIATYLGITQQSLSRIRRQK